MADEKEEIKMRQQKLAKDLGIVGIELEVVKNSISVDEEEKTVEIARRIGIIQARFLPMHPKEQS